LASRITKVRGAQRRTKSDCASEPSNRSYARGVVVIGMNIEPEPLAFDRLQFGREPDRKLARTVAADQQMGTAFRLEAVGTPPTCRGEAERAKGAGPSDWANQRHRINVQFRRPSDQRQIGRRYFGRYWER